MTTRDIQAQWHELYGVEVSPTLISTVTEAVMDEVRQWQARPLEPLYPIVYVDCLVVKVRENQRVLNTSVYLVLGVDLTGQKDLLGMWIAQTEGARVLARRADRTAEPWGQRPLHCLCRWTDRLTRSHRERLSADTCAIVHGATGRAPRLGYVSYKHMKEVATGLKAIYSASTEAEAELNLELEARDMGSALSQHQQGMARTLGQRSSLVCLPRRHSQSDLHD
jgi:transposase-like protein